MQKKIDDLDSLVEKLNDIKFDISKSTINLQSSLLEKNQEIKKSSVFDSPLKTFNSDINRNKLKLEVVKNELISHSLNFNNEFNDIIKELNSIQESYLKGSGDILNVSVKLTSLVNILNQNFENKNSDFKKKYAVIIYSNSNDAFSYGVFFGL